jgi:acyl carrier protein
LLTERLHVASDADAIGDEDTLADLGLDSTAILSLVVGLEDAFDIEIADREINPDNFGRVDARRDSTHDAGRPHPRRHGHDRKPARRHRVARE